jgi:hypothetical protein
MSASRKAAYNRQKVKSKGGIEHAHSPQPSPQVLLFAREDWSLYTSLATLPQRAGVTAGELPRLVAKEFGDNALDSADAAGRPGAVEISIDRNGNLTVADQGTGILGATPEQIARLFCIARPMVSSKLLRRPTRGAVGNGLRVCLGYLTATGGRLIIKTGSVHVELTPEINGHNSIVRSNAIAPVEGLTLTAIAGDTRFTEKDLAWAEDAIELAQQSGAPAFTGRPSVHWIDLDHWRVLLHAAVGNVSVRQFLPEFDGLTGSAAQSRVASNFLRRLAASLNADEAAQLLAAAQAATKPPKAKELRPLGKDAVVTAGYAIAEGSFTEGQHTPHATIPFICEAWADAFLPEEQEDPLTGALFMNRTWALVPYTGSVWHGRLDLTINGTTIRTPVPAGPHYSVHVNITAPLFRLTSDGKTPDVRPFHDALTNAVAKAAKQAGSDIAAEMNEEQKRRAAFAQRKLRAEAGEKRLSDRLARQQHLAEIAARKAERKALPTIRDVVLELLPGAIEREAASGLMFNTRRLVYAMRDEVQERTGEELTQGYFDTLVTELEAKHGDLHTPRPPSR